MQVESNAYVVLAAIAIICLSLVFFPPGTTYYYQVPMGIIGNVYANSMLLLINSRMQFFSEKPPMIISTARFGMAPTNHRFPVVEGHNRDLSVHTEEMGRTFEV